MKKGARVVFSFTPRWSKHRSYNRLVKRVFLLLLLACGPKASPKAEPKPVQPPDWVTRGSGASAGAHKAFYGVGSSEGIKNIKLARSTAANRARGEVFKLVEVFSASLMRDISVSTTAGDFTISEEMQRVGKVLKTFSAAVLNQTEVVDYWTHPNGTIYALAKYDVDKLLEEVQKSRLIAAPVREAVKRSVEENYPKAR